MKYSKPCSKKSKDESIPAIDVSMISGKVTHQPVELLEEEDEGEYRGIHNFFEEEGAPEEEKEWETEKEETVLGETPGEAYPADEGIKLDEPTSVLSSAPVPVSIKNPTPIKLSEAP